MYICPIRLEFPVMWCQCAENSSPVISWLFHECRWMISGTAMGKTRNGKLQICIKQTQLICFIVFSRNKKLQTIYPYLFLFDCFGRPSFLVVLPMGMFFIMSGKVAPFIHKDKHKICRQNPYFSPVVQVQK